MKTAEQIEREDLARANRFFDLWTMAVVDGERVRAALALAEEFRAVRQDERVWCADVAVEAMRMGRRTELFR